MLTFSTSVDISSLEPRSSGDLKIENQELGEVAHVSFELPVEVPGVFGNLNISELGSEELPHIFNYNQLLNLLREAGIEYNFSTKEFKIIGDDYTLDFPLNKNNLIATKFEDPFYDNLKKEINSCFRFGFYTSVAVLSRKLIENLVIDVLRKKYPLNKIRKLGLYYDKKRKRFHDFTILLDSLEKTKSKFGIDEEIVSKFISLAKPFRPSTNAKAHSIIEVSDKDEIRRYKIPEMIGLLIRLKTHI